jgi:hypothetical protein
LKILSRVAAVIVICVVLLLFATRITGFEPNECQTASSLGCKLPGLWLKGEVVTHPVNDWAFTNQVHTIKIQTQTPIMLPYSVAAWCAVYNGNLYLTSYRGRRWVEDIVSNPNVRLKIGDQLYDRSLTIVNDPAEKAAVLQAKAKKYPEWKPPTVEASTVLRVNPN